MNACSELYIGIINKRIDCLKEDDVSGVWSLVRDISRVVMGDAPLLDIFSADWSKQKEEVEKVEAEKQEEEEEENVEDQGAEALTTSKSVESETEWMWQASLLSLEGSYSVIRKLFEMVRKDDPIIYRILSELIRLCCHSTTISYEGSRFECIQTLGLCILNDVITHYASVPDTEDPSRYYIEQFEIQIISAIRRVLTLSAVYDPVMLSVNIVYVLITSGVITDKSKLD